MKTPFGLHPTILLIAGTHFLVDGFSNIYAPLLPLLIPHLNLSLFAAGTLQMCFLTANSVAQLGFGHLADILGRHAEFFGGDQRVIGPLRDVEPLFVALANSRSERLLGDDLRENDVVVRIIEGQADRVEARLVGRIDVATAGVIRGVDFLKSLEHDRVVGHVVGIEIIGQIELGRRAGLNANRRAGKLKRGSDFQFAADHEALAVIIGDADEVETERGVAVHRPGRVARQDIDLAGLKRGETFDGGQGRIANGFRIVKDRCRHGAAKIDIEAGPGARVVGVGEAGKTGADAALDEALFPNAFECLRRSRLRAQTERGCAGKRRQNNLCHRHTFLTVSLCRPRNTGTWHSKRFGRPLPSFPDPNTIYHMTKRARGQGAAAEFPGKHKF